MDTVHSVLRESKFATQVMKDFTKSKNRYVPEPFTVQSPIQLNEWWQEKCHTQGLESRRWDVRNEFRPAIINQMRFVLESYYSLSVYGSHVYTHQSTHQSLSQYLHSVDTFFRRGRYKLTMAIQITFIRWYAERFEAREQYMDIIISEFTTRFKNTSRYPILYMPTSRALNYDKMNASLSVPLIYFVSRPINIHGHDQGPAWLLHHDLFIHRAAIQTEALVMTREPTDYVRMYFDFSERLQALADSRDMHMHKVFFYLWHEFSPSTVDLRRLAIQLESEQMSRMELDGFAIRREDLEKIIAWLQGLGLLAIVGSVTSY